VIQLRKITPAGVPKLDDIKESLRDTIKRDQAVDTATRFVNKLDDELAAGHALEDVADEMKLRLIKIPALFATGKTPDGKDPAELPYKADVLKTAFAQNSGDTSPVMDDRNGSYFVVRTDTVTPSAVKVFDQVKADVITAWKKQEQIKLAQEKAESIAKSLRDGKPASSLAEKDIEARVSKPVSMLGDTDPALPKSALPQILKLKKGEVVVVPDGDKQLILRLADIVPADDKKDDVAAGKINAELNNAAPKELSDEYLKYLHTLFPVTIKPDAFDSIAQQGS
jgi:peptidyl-prolyl cis-trans isomerase D